MLDHERSCLTCSTLRPETPATAGGFVAFDEWTEDIALPYTTIARVIRPGMVGPRHDSRRNNGGSLAGRGPVL